MSFKSTAETVWICAVAAVMVILAVPVALLVLAAFVMLGGSLVQLWASELWTFLYRGGWVVILLIVIVIASYWFGRQDATRG